MDAGPIVAQREERIGENENATSLLPRLFEIGTEMLIDILPSVIAGKITMETASLQNEDQVVNADMIDSSEGELFLEKDSARICHNKVKGFSMWPGTFIFVRIGEVAIDNEPMKLKILESRVLSDDASENMSSEIVLGPNKGDGLRVVCGDGSVLELLRVQPVTRNAMDAKSFVNGLRGEKLYWVDMSEIRHSRKE